MASPVIQISIPFKPLLTKITQCLQFPEPQYTVLNFQQHSVSVTVTSDCEPEEYIYIGGASSNLEESSEKAARMAITDLIEKFDIYIPDFTSAKKQRYERCANLWKLKQEEIKRLRKGLSKLPLVEEFECNEMRHSHSVSLDMVPILMIITKKLPINCGSIVTLEHTPSSFTSWLTINHHNVEHEATYILGDVAPSAIASQENVAHKAIKYLIPIYNIDIIDANYAPEEVKFSALICEYAKRRFENFVKHVLEVKDNQTLIPDEEDCTTPKGGTHSIPILKNPPPPPKKQRTDTPVSSICIATRIPNPLTPPTLHLK
ncbi:hypothetical protein RND81_02G080500 [Saponaria officinalis]|uniref:DRBM domain-containing protein n=1 Tax=Saponaria officinalis TaxID=3572 RepID=A0AAW1MSI9_SAPOF